MKRTLITDLHRAAKARKPGYLAACEQAGRIEGEWLVFTDEAHAKLRDQYAIVTVRGADPRRGLGDLVHSVAGPIGKAIHWPCLKGDGTTNLRPGSPCDKTRRALNKIKIPGG